MNRAPSAAERAHAMFSEGMALHQRGRLDDASALYRRVLQLMPCQADALHMLGVAEFQLGRYGIAEQLISQAVAKRPRDALAHFNHGNALRKLGRLEAAATAYQMSLSLRPNDIDTLSNLGSVLKEQNRLDPALAVYDRLLALRPGHPQAQYNKALALLMQGRLAEGWDLYDHRLACDTGDARHLGHTLPRQAPDWDGRMTAKPLLVLPEQGLGDQIFYGAMLHDLQAARIEAYACLDARLLPLFRRSFPDIDFALPTEIGGLDPALQLFGAQVQIGSLGKFFRRDASGLARVPSPFLRADSDATARLRSRLRQGGKLVCGLSWASKNADTGATKSLPLAAMLPVLRVPGVEFIDLQYGDTAAERHALVSETGIVVRRLDDIDNRNDIDGLAALIMACDLVITVSNSTAHLAAALGKPVLILLAHHTPLWYWHLSGEHSPWYPSATLLRQPAQGDWNPTVAQAAALLAAARQVG